MFLDPLVTEGDSRDVQLLLQEQMRFFFSSVDVGKYFPLDDPKRELFAFSSFEDRAALLTHDVG